MNRLSKILIVFSLLSFCSAKVYCDTAKGDRQLGFGLGAASPYPATGSFPFALTAVLEGTYRWKVLGLSILATATSSPKTGGTYWFGSNGGYQQTLLEPRLYLSLFHLGLSMGVNLTEGSGVIQTIASYGAMAGIEFPLGRCSLGADGRYLWVSSGSNPTPLSAILMFRLAF